MSGAIHFSQLRHYRPLSTFPRAQLIELAEQACVSEPADRSLIFDTPHGPFGESLYLLAGEASVVTTVGMEAVVEVGTPGAAHPLNDGRFRSVTAYSEVVLMSLPFELVDLISTWDQLAVVERRSIDRATAFFGRGIRRRWSYAFFPALRSTPPARIEELMQSFVPQAVQERQIMARQGEPAREFYVVDRGTALATRESPAEEGDSIELAQMGEGECFGVEALGDAPASTATVSMISEGVLMRLPVEDFQRLQTPPQQALLATAAAIELISTGGHWLDVRQRGEWQNSHLPGAYNLPLQEIRLHAGRLDPTVHYVCYCNSGRRAAAAAHILTQIGIAASVLSGHYRQVGGE